MSKKKPSSKSSKKNKRKGASNNGPKQTNDRWAKDFLAGCDQDSTHFVFARMAVDICKAATIYLPRKDYQGVGAKRRYIPPKYNTVGYWIYRHFMSYYWMYIDPNESWLDLPDLPMDSIAMHGLPFEDTESMGFKISDLPKALQRCLKKYGKAKENEALVLDFPTYLKGVVSSIPVGLRDMFIFPEENKPIASVQEEAKPPGGTRKPAKKRGRPSDTDHKKDKMLSDAWKTHSYEIHADLAKEMGLPVHEVKAALDRQRKREARERDKKNWS